MCVTCLNHTSFHLLTVAKKRFLWTHKEVDLTLNPVVGLVLQVGDVEKFPQALGFESLDPSFSQQAGLCFTNIEEDGGDRRLVPLYLA